MTVTSLVQILWSVSALGLIVLVLLHSPKGDGIGSIGGQAQLFTSAKSAESTLNRVTWTLFVVFIGLSIVLSANWLAPSITAPPSPDTLPPVQ
jgi:preprotein translocase subunit SecG